MEGLEKKSNVLMGSGVHVQPENGASSVPQPLALIHTHQELPGAAYGFKSLFQSQEWGDIIAAAGQDMLPLAGVAVSPSPASAQGSTSRGTGACWPQANLPGPCPRPSCPHFPHAHHPAAGSCLGETLESGACRRSNLAAALTPPAPAAPACLAFLESEAALPNNPKGGECPWQGSHRYLGFPLHSLGHGFVRREQQRPEVFLSLGTLGIRLRKDFQR